MISVRDSRSSNPQARRRFLRQPLCRLHYGLLHGPSPDREKQGQMETDPFRLIPIHLSEYADMIGERFRFRHGQGLCSSTVYL